MRDPTPVLINCTFEDSADVNVTITKGGQVIKKGKNPLYLKMNVTKRDDFGEYLCSVVGDASQKLAFIIVNAGDLQ